MLCRHSAVITWERPGQLTEQEGNFKIDGLKYIICKWNDLGFEGRILLSYNWSIFNSIPKKSVVVTGL